MRRLVRGGRRMVRWFLVASGPLCRGTDRVERAFRLLLLVALLAAAPVAVLISSAVHRHEAASAAHEAAIRHAVHAVVLADPAVPDGATPDVVVPTEVGWTTAQRTQRTATVPVPVIDRAGDRVVVWLTRSGHVTSAPPDAGELAANAASVGFLSAVALPLTALALLALARLVLNARRSRQWQVHWQVVEPVWTAREH